MSVVRIFATYAPVPGREEPGIVYVTSQLAQSSSPVVAFIALHVKSLLTTTPVAPAAEIRREPAPP